MLLRTLACTPLPGRHGRFLGNGIEPRENLSTRAPLRPCYRYIYIAAPRRDYTGGLILFGLFYLSFAVLSTRPGRVVMALALSVCLLAAIGAAVVHELDQAGIVKQEAVQRMLEEGWSSTHTVIEQAEAHRLSLRETLPRQATHWLASLHAVAARHAWVLILAGLCLVTYGSRSWRRLYRF